MASGEERGPLGLPIGIQLYTVNAEMLADGEETLRALAEIGFAEVETAGTGSLKTAREVRRVLDANGLRCPSAHLQFDMQNLNRALDEAHELGCRYAATSVPRMLLWPVIEHAYDLTPAEFVALIERISAPMALDEFKRTAEALNQVGEAARRSGLRFAAHNHMMEMAAVEGATGLDYLMAQTDPELVDFELDCGWAEMMGQDAAGFIERHPGRVTMLHVKDFLPHQGEAAPTFFSVKGVELGGGIVDYPKLFARVGGEGIEHIFVEQDGPFSRMPALDAARADWEYLRGIAGEER
jgi:sugar phosphate isomerase/epimerase